MLSALLCPNLSTHLKNKKQPKKANKMHQKAILLCRVNFYKAAVGNWGGGVIDKPDRL